MDELHKLHAERPPQSQCQQPGQEAEMQPRPRPLVIRDDYRSSGKLAGRAALITGGERGIGRAVTVHFAREGANVAFVYLNEYQDAEEALTMVEAEGRHCLMLRGDVADESWVGQSSEVTPAYVFLASDDASCFAGQVLHSNGGDVMT